MQRRWLAGLVLPLVLGVAHAHAGDQPRETPTIVVRVRSLDALLENLQLVVKLVNQENAVNQIEGLIKSRIGKKGLEGVDPTRPFGLYAKMGKELDDIRGAVLIPIADENAFLTMLAQQNFAVTKDRDGIYTYKTNANFNLYFRFAHKYLYATSVSTDNIEGSNLLDPAKALAVVGDPTFSLQAQLDQVPEGAKQFALVSLAKTLEIAQRRQPGESKQQEEFRLAVLREFDKFSTSLINDAGALRIDLDVDRKTKDLTFNINVAAKAGTDLARSIEAMGSLKSPLGPLARPDVAFHGAVRLAWPDPLNRAVAGLLDEAAQKSLEGIRDEMKKKQAEALFKALLPTAKAGEVQLVATALGPVEERYTFVAALKLKDGLKLGKTVTGLITEALKDIPPELRDKIRLDFDQAGAIGIHQFELPKEAALEKLLTNVVDDRRLYVAFRDDALFLALGKEALPALKAAVARTANAPSPPFVFDFDAARMAPLMAQTPEQKDLAARLFPADASAPVRVSLTGGARLNLRVQMRLSVVEFLVKMK